jgi:uncharacterized protein YycO
MKLNMPGARKENNNKTPLWFFPVAAGVMTGIILLLNLHLLAQTPQTAAYVYLSNALHGNLGSGYGFAYVPAPDIELEPGDILLGGWENCAYGRYSHAGLFIGDGQILEGYADYGITIQPLSHYMNYAYLSILRVQTDEATRAAAVAYAKRQQGKIFHPLAFKSGERYWNCTKILWKAYAENGIDLDVLGDIWITPEALQRSPQVENLYER